MYKCIKGFSLEKCDGDGFTIENDYTTIEEGSIWHLPEDENYRLIGGEIRLENDEYGWIEISKETLEEHFKIVNKEYEKVWEEFWKDIVCNKDGSINVEQVKKELCDYNFMLEQVPKVYSHITNGLLGKPNYKAETVINEFESCQNVLIDKEMAKDDLLQMLDGEITEESKKEIEEYFS